MQIALHKNARTTPAVRAHTGQGLGIELLSLAETDTAIAQASQHQFLGIWRFPNPQARDALLAAIEASGWYLYFEHVNAASSAGAVDTHLAALAAV